MKKFLTKITLVFTLLLGSMGLTSYIYAQEIHNQTKDNITIRVTDYQEMPHKSLFSIGQKQIKASDFAKNGIRPVMVTITNNTGRCLDMVGRYIAQDNPAAFASIEEILDCCIEKNSMLNGVVRFATAIPALYSIYHLSTNNNFGGYAFLPLLGFDKSMVSWMSPWLTTYCAIKNLNRENLMVMSSVWMAKLVRELWGAQRKDVEEHVRKQVLCCFDYHKLRPGTSYTTICMLYDKTRSLNISLGHHDDQKTKSERRKTTFNVPL